MTQSAHTTTETPQTWTARAVQQGKFWLIDIDEFGTCTQARTVKEIPVMAKDYIHAVTNEPLAQIHVDVQVELPAAVVESLAKAERLRAEADAARKAAAAESRRAARALQAAGLSVRDIGVALGLSHQRAHQLINS